ncbi:PREDICTED: uncharacterized protein LOC105569107 isoform X2 [Vollenhovia emeryi]|uniref:uncharacterized protein LOC105569107 isoform X2 n=1 Tax=Vollenhovia emeryi TaxID=411798 RepID=UPI0005F57879|nr:PREDICTED: uncharacterized protein LOC105569107 isoform X2 [Vollenhovia emeryi]
MRSTRQRGHGAQWRIDSESTSNDTTAVEELQSSSSPTMRTMGGLLENGRITNVTLPWRNLPPSRSISFLISVSRGDTRDSLEGEKCLDARDNRSYSFLFIFATVPRMFRAPP